MSVVAGGLVTSLGVPATPAAAAGIVSITAVGNRTWVVPDGVFSATFEMYGAQGGNGGWDPNSTLDGTGDGTGGLGGHTRVTIPVNPGEVYDLMIGGQGGNANVATGQGGAGGFGGGGRGGDVDNSRYHLLGGGGGGGGRTEVSLNGATVLVAGGGGGGGGSGAFATLTAWCTNVRIGGGGGGGAGGSKADDGGSGPDGHFQNGVGGRGGDLFLTVLFPRRLAGGGGWSSWNSAGGGGGGGGYDSGDGGHTGGSINSGACVDDGQAQIAIGSGGGGGGGTGYAPENATHQRFDPQFSVMENSVNHGDGRITITYGDSTVPTLSIGTIAGYRYPDDPTHFAYGEIVDASLTIGTPLLGGLLVDVDGSSVAFGTIIGTAFTEFGYPMTRLQIGQFQPGHHVLRVRYTGDSVLQAPGATNVAVYSNSVEFEVDQPPPFVVTLTSSPNPSAQYSGGVTFTAVQESGLSAGNVTFEIDGHIAQRWFTMPGDPPSLCANITAPFYDPSTYRCVSYEVMSVGVHVITAHFSGTSLTPSADVSILHYVAGPAATLEVTAPAGAVAGSPFDVTVRAVDAQGTTVPNFAGTVQFSSSDPAGQLPDAYTFTSADAGIHTFTGGATLAGASNGTTITVGTSTVHGSATVAITPGALDHLTLTANPGTASPGEPVTVAAFGADAYGNSLGEVTEQSTFTVDGSACSANVCTATTPGDHTVVATDGDATGSDRFTISAPTVDHIVVSPSSATITAGGSQEYTIEAFDAGNNSLGDVTGATSLSMTPDGECTGASCAATVAGAHSVIATYDGAVASAALEVAPGPLDHVAMTPSSATIEAGVTQTFSVTGYDAYSNSLGDETEASRFAVSPDGSCTAAQCVATTAGDHTVTATVGGVSTTAQVYVSPGPFDHITASPPSATITAGDAQTFSASAFDAFDNPLGDVTASTSFTIGPDGSCAGASCSATVAGAHVVTASYGDATVDVELEVDPGAVDHLAISPASATVTAGTTQASTVTAFDAYGNTWGDVTASATFTITPDGSCTGSTCTATAAGEHTIRATVGALSATTTWTVTPATPALLRLTPVFSTVKRNVYQAYRADALDRYGNLIGDVTSSTTFSIYPDGSCSANRCTGTKKGLHLIVATRGTTLGVAVLDVA